MPQVRRSTRQRTKSSVDSPDDEDAGEVIVDANTVVDEALSEDDESSDEEENDQDEDYEEPSKVGKRKTTAQRSGTASKRGKTGNSGSSRAASRGNGGSSAGSRRDEEEFLEIAKSFEPTEMFEILATSDGISIDEVARNWLDTYRENRDGFLQEFINLLLCCCGAVAHVEEHDVRSNESSNKTIEEVQLMFQRQKIHEFHLMISKRSSKKSKYPHLYENFVELMSRLMEVANEAQLICEESSEEGGQIITGPFIVDLLTWLSSLSVCKLRSLRYIATLTLYLFQDYLTEHVVDLEKRYLAKLSKQLKMEQNKKRPNDKTLQKLESTIDEIQGNKMVLRDVIDNIVKLCFVHRFKDVDSAIRSLSMIHLSLWIQSYPEYFMKVTFLKYYGWLLSDSSPEVRSQVLKILPQFITRQNNKLVDNSALRQFFERFKERILEIALKDEVLDVRLHAVGVLTEVAALGYLEDSEVLAISSLIFDDNEVKVSSRGKSSRFLTAVAKFLSQVTSERVTEFTKSHEPPNELFGISTASLIKIGIFTRLLNESLISYLQEKTDDDPDKKIRILFQAAEFLYTFFGSLIQDICRMLTYDGEFDHPSLRSESNAIEGDEGDENDIQLLLPCEGNSTIFYVTILYGLCYGGCNVKNQPRFDVAEAVLPHLDKLMTQLPIQSSNVLSALTGIFNLFSLEDWIHTGYEKSIRRTLDRIIKAFAEASLNSSRTDLKYKSLSESVKHTKELNLDELNESWQNQIVHLKILLEKFLDERLSDGSESFEDHINVLGTMFVNKLALLGKFFPIEFDQALLDKFLEKFLLRIPSEFQNIESATAREMNFSILALLATWEIQKWTENLEKNPPNNAHLSIPDYGSRAVSKIVRALEKVLVELNDANDSAWDSNNLSLKLSVSDPLIDILISLKVVELGRPNSERSYEPRLKGLFPMPLPKSTCSALLSIFLYLESVCARKAKVHLDRAPEEDANLNDISEEMATSDCEKRLLVFTIKLKGLIKLGLLSGDIIDRIALNKDKLSPLFAQVIDDSIFDQEKNGKVAGKQLNRKVIPEPSTAEEPADIDMLQDDPIENSEI